MEIESYNQKYRQPFKNKYGVTFPGFWTFLTGHDWPIGKKRKERIFDRFRDAVKPHKAPSTAVVRVEIGKHGQQYASMNPISLQLLSEQNIAPWCLYKFSVQSKVKLIKIWTALPA